jgi:alkylated DNA repair dioxygenase AlkB
MGTPSEQGFTSHELSTGHRFLIGRLPEGLTLAGARLEELWELHPEKRATVRIVGRRVQTPRWQKAYGRDYRFAGGTAEAEEVPPLLEPYLAWARGQVNPLLNGLLVNWYDGSAGHYIGPHHDDPHDLVPGSPVVTISLGEERVFRFTLPRPGPAPRKREVLVGPGSVVVIPWDTNGVWKHSVPRLARYRGKRVSITARAFSEGP